MSNYEKYYKNFCQVYIRRDLHKILKEKSKEKGMILSRFIENILDEYVKKEIKWVMI